MLVTIEELLLAVYILVNFNKLNCV